MVFFFSVALLCVQRVPARLRVRTHVCMCVLMCWMAQTACKPQKAVQSIFAFNGKQLLVRVLLFSVDDKIVAFHKNAREEWQAYVWIQLQSHRSWDFVCVFCVRFACVRVLFYIVVVAVIVVLSRQSMRSEWKGHRLAKNGEIDGVEETIHGRWGEKTSPLPHHIELYHNIKMVVDNNRGTQKRTIQL